jgi:predicted XRE-type DNA-binding protein
MSNINIKENIKSAIKALVKDDNLHQNALAFFRALRLQRPKQRER